MGDPTAYLSPLVIRLHRVQILDFLGGILCLWWRWMVGEMLLDSHCHFGFLVGPAEVYYLFLRRGNGREEKAGI